MQIFEKPYKKKPIPKALREQVWLTYMGPVFEAKCKVGWCSNKMNVFNFQCGHNIPERKGGKTSLTNLIPICARCNISMGDRYTIDEWNVKFAGDPKSHNSKVGSCFFSAGRVPCFRWSTT